MNGQNIFCKSSKQINIDTFCFQISAVFSFDEFVFPGIETVLSFRKKIKKAEIIWLERNINCKVKYLELDEFGMMRHASFRGMSA